VNAILAIRRVNSMKVLAFVDLHSDLSSLKKIEKKIEKEKPDLVLNLGDYTIFEQNVNDVAKRLSKIHTEQYVIQGNHEEASTTQLMCKRYEWKFLHNKMITKNGVLFVGSGGGGFTSKSKQFEEFVKKNHEKIKSAEKVVLMTHQPPKETKLDKLHGRFTGNSSYTKFIKKYKNVVLAISGHIHETAGKKDKLNNAKLSNPGPEGEVFKI
jgi:Icc-related predicted phosphoesterase